MNALFSVIIVVLLLFPFGVNAGGWVDTNKTNCKMWDEKPDSNLTISWSGKCLGGYASGSGTVIWYQNSKENGRYVGQIKLGKLTGKSTYTWAGQKYEGDFVSGNFQGKGIYTYANGNKYEGDFVNDMCNGIGTYTCSNGKQFTGNFKNNQTVGFTIICN